jgi:hypothetical protein
MGLRLTDTHVAPKYHPRRLVTIPAPAHQTKTEKNFFSDQSDGFPRRNFLKPRRAAN